MGERWLYGALAALFVGTVLLLVNGYSTVGIFHIFTGGDAKASSSDITKWLLGLVGTGLLPLLKPDLIKRGMNPHSVWDKALFWLAGTSFLVGIPLQSLAFSVNKAWQARRATPLRSAPVTS